MNFPRQSSPTTPGDGDPRTPGDEPALHVASTQDRTDERTRDELLGAILCRADLRDAAAEARDRSAEARVPGDDRQSALDRVWAARDREAAAEDRADLVDVLHPGASATSQAST